MVSNFVTSHPFAKTGTPFLMVSCAAVHYYTLLTDGKQSRAGLAALFHQQVDAIIIIVSIMGRYLQFRDTGRIFLSD